MLSEKGSGKSLPFFYVLERLKTLFLNLHLVLQLFLVSAIKMLLHCWRYLYTPHLFFLLDCRKGVLCISTVAPDVSQVHYWRLIKIDWIISIPVWCDIQSLVIFKTILLSVMDHLFCYYGVKFDKCTLEERIKNQFQEQGLCIAKFCLKFHNGF